MQLVPEPRRIRRLLVTTTLAVAVLAPGAAGAASPTQISPRSGALLALGSQPSFKVRDGSAAARRYGVFIRISTSKRRRANGDLRSTSIGTFAKMRRRASVFSYTPKDYSFPTWFMARAGTYYWQAYRIDCSTGNSSCHVHTRIRSFRVR